MNPVVFAIIPVYNRLQRTLECLQCLTSQSYNPMQIIVSDGGSTDGTVEFLQREHPGITVLTSDKELWWTGAVAMGIDYALRQGNWNRDFALFMNNDTLIGPDYVETLVNASKKHGSAVGALIVDSRDQTKILDAGEYIVWEKYDFQVKTVLAPGEIYCDDVDFLPGRGSLAPLKMIRMAGNVDPKKWPHYLADYEFFYRIKSHGFRLGVCYQTFISAHIEETGIAPTTGKSNFRRVWAELFSRRSMSNAIDHWRFANRHAPEEHVSKARLLIIGRVFSSMAFRTPLRFFFVPISGILSAVWKTLICFKRQPRQFLKFLELIGSVGIDVVCHPHRFPGSIRIPLSLIASPGPMTRPDVEDMGLNLDDLIRKDVLRKLSTDGWYAFNTLDSLNKSEAEQTRKLFWWAWNPFNKVSRVLAYISDIEGRDAP